ncbi:MAG: rod shape-determining protein RodA [Actinomycetota bacterium]
MAESILRSNRADFNRDASRARLSSKAPIRHLDMSLIPIVALLTAAGCLAIRSASGRLLQVRGGDVNFYLKRQVIYFALASIIFVITLLFDYRFLRDYAPLLLGAGVLMLVIVLTPLGNTQAGAQRWIDFGVLQVQPAEIMKMVIVAALGAMLAGERGVHSFSQVVWAMVLVLIPASLVYVQPDLGTVMVFLAIAFGVLLIAGTRVRWLLVIVLAGVVAIVGVLQLGILKDYQVARLTAFMDTSADLQRTGFNLAQSKIAIGSGGFQGKGLGNGSQTNLNYVPEQHTDFIFTAIGEEQGFLGGVAIIGLFALLLWRSLRIATLSKDKFGTLLAAGVAAMFGFQLFVNIGMTVGIMPITGIPLPFVSYGGSSLITSYFGVGVLMNIHMRRFV